MKSGKRSRVRPEKRVQIVRVLQKLTDLPEMREVPGTTDATTGPITSVITTSATIGVDLADRETILANRETILANRETIGEITGETEKVPTTVIIATTATTDRTEMARRGLMKKEKLISTILKD